MNTDAVCAMLETLRGRGLACTVSQAGTLQVRPPGKLTLAERNWLRTNAGEVVEFLDASNDMNSTDSFIAASGVSGSDPELKPALDAVQLAVAGKNAGDIREACAAVREAVKRVLAVRKLETQLERN